MHDTFLVRRFQRFTDLLRNGESFIDGQCAALINNVRERVAFDEFKNEEASRLALLKIVNPGNFRISPARVQPMYQPQYLSTTESKLLEVK